MLHKSKSSYNRGGLLDSTTQVYRCGGKVMSLGGVLGEIGAGAGSGALMGLAAGPGAAITAPLGALIGGGIGLFKGLLGNRAENLAEEQQQSFVPEFTEPPRPQSSRVFNTGMPNIPTFEQGGLMSPQEASEMKMDEKSIDKMLIEIDGPMHEDGGIALAGNEVEGKETLFRFKGEGGVERYIFSNATLVPGTKKTFAKASLEIEG